MHGGSGLTAGAGARRRLFLDLLAVALVAWSVWRIATSGVLVTAGVPAWFGDELPPLVDFVVDGKPITHINQRQYGVVTFLIFHPVLAIFGRDTANADRSDRTLGMLPESVVAIDLWASATQLAANLGAIYLLNRRFFGGALRSYALLAGAYFSFIPSVFSIGIRGADSWQLLFLSASLFLYTSTGAKRLLTGVPLAVGMLAKLLPAFVLAFICLRFPRAGIIGGATAVVLLGVGHLMYGSLMGFAYPFTIAAAGQGIVDAINLHQENNAIRGLLFKAAAGYRLESDFRVFAPSGAAILNLVAYALEAVLFAYLVWVGLRSRRVDSLESRSLEFGLAIVTMLVVSPATGYEYMMATIISFVALFYVWRRRAPRPWPAWLTSLALAGFVVIGVFIPFSVLARLLPLEWLMHVAGNASSSFATSPIGAYQFFGFPGYGLLLTYAALAIALERLIAAGGTAVQTADPARRAMA